MTNSLTTTMKETLLLSAFTSLIDDESLSDANHKIEKKLNSFIEDVKKQFQPEQRILDSVESRKKSKESFLEKIYRKDYIYTWEISDNPQNNIDLIAKNLPDLLGYRINCYFYEDESKIFDAIKRCYDDNYFGEDIRLDFSENKTQKNGHSIYKLSGLYKGRYHFEIQIKSLMHNIWGEVEHKTVYKNRNYDVNTTTKEIFTSEILNILLASDKQLSSLFRSQIKEKELVQALFFEKTKEIIAVECRSDILASHYSGFFELFDQCYESIRKYVALVLLGQEFHRMEVWKASVTEKVRKLKERISSEFFEYYLSSQHHIFELLYQDTDYDMFLTLLSEMLCNRFDLLESDDPYAAEESAEDSFSDEEDEDIQSEENNYKSIMIKLNEMIGGWKNDNH